MGRFNRRTGRRKFTEFGESALKNRIAHDQYLERLTELAISMFDWQNLPDTVDARFLELALFSEGMSVFFKDEVVGYLCLKVMPQAPLDVYEIPRGRRAYAVNGYQKELTIDDSVIIYNNMLHTNSVTMVEMFATRLAELDRIVEINAQAQKTPLLVQGSETQRLTLKNLYKEYAGNAPVIFGDKNLDINSLKVLKTDAPYVADKIYQLKMQIWNEALTYLGISNLNIQKKERLISDEAIRSQGGTIASRYSRLSERRNACDKINDMFGLNISVDFREDYRQTDDEYMVEGESEDGVLNPMVLDLRTRSPIKEVNMKERSTDE